MRVDSIPRRVDGPTARQRSMRGRLSGHSLKSAVRLAADAFFHFRYRAARAEALWSEAERVWLGRETFLYWALRDAEIDIPSAVAAAADAPDDADDLRDVVRTELIAYWADRTVSLPCRGRPSWLPLP